MTAEIVEYDNVPLATSQRCDRCDAQALVEVILPSERKLLFCGHDYGKHEEQLKVTALTIGDHRKYMLAQESAHV